MFADSFSTPACFYWPCLHLCCRPGLLSGLLPNHPLRVSWKVSPLENQLICCLFPSQHLCPFLLVFWFSSTKQWSWWAGCRGVQFPWVIPISPPRNCHMAQAKPVIWILVRLTPGSKIVGARFFWGWWPENPACWFLFPDPRTSMVSVLPKTSL